MKIKEAYDRLVNFQQKLEATAMQSIDKTKEDLVDLNLIQMNQGKRSDGTDIKPDYTDYTIYLKKLKGQPTDRVTLYDTGDYYKRTTAEVKGKKVIIDSSDEKAEKLDKKYATAKGKLHGLNDQFKREYVAEYLRPVWKKAVTDLTGLKFGR